MRALTLKKNLVTLFSQHGRLLEHESERERERERESGRECEGVRMRKV